MKTNLSPIEIAAIASAGLALFLLLSILFHHIYRRSHPRLPLRSRSTTPIAHPNPRRTTFTTFGFGMPQSSLPLHNSHIAASPSTGHTTLVTPTASVDIGIGGKLKLKKSGTGTRGVSPEIELGGYGVEDEEFVVVTYEEGLAELGMRLPVDDLKMGMGMGGKPHHVLCADPPAFEDIQGVGYSPGGVFGSERTIHGREGLGAGNGKWRERMREGRPGGGEGGDGSGGSEGGQGGLQRNGTLQSSWLPSYYHAEHRGREVEEEDSDLGYRAGL